MGITDVEAMASLCRHNAELKQCIRDMQKELEDKDIELHIDRETLLQEYIPRAEFEQRLKDDMVAMLEDLKQDFIAEAYGIEMDCTDYVVNVADIDKVIQQKINALKENNHDD